MVSLIVPVLNEGGTITECLENLTALKGRKEIIVVDGGSRDSTVRLTRRYRGVRLFKSPAGRAKQMNAGAKRARGSTLMFVHADSRLPREALTQAEAACAKDDVVGGRFNLRLDAPGFKYRLTEELINARSRLTRIATGDQCIFVKRHVFERLGGYADIPLMEDVELCSRLRREGRFVALSARARTSARRWEKNGFWPTVILMWSLRGLYAAGVPASRLAQWYSHVR